MFLNLFDSKKEVKAIVTIVGFEKEAHCKVKIEFNSGIAGSGVGSCVDLLVNAMRDDQGKTVEEIEVVREV